MSELITLASCRNVPARAVARLQGILACRVAPALFARLYLDRGSELGGNHDTPVSVMHHNEAILCARYAIGKPSPAYEPVRTVEVNLNLAVVACGYLFGHVLRAKLNPHQRASVVARNSRETPGTICHVHGFCDAHQIWVEILDRIDWPFIPRHVMTGELMDRGWRLGVAMLDDGKYDDNGPLPAVAIE